MIVIASMAGYAHLLQRVIVLVGHMAALARDLLVLAFQGKFSFTRVIERRVIP